MAKESVKKGKKPTRKNCDEMANSPGGMGLEKAPKAKKADVEGQEHHGGQMHRCWACGSLNFVRHGWGHFVCHRHHCRAMNWIGGHRRHHGG